MIATEDAVKLTRPVFVVRGKLFIGYIHGGIDYARH